MCRAFTQKNKLTAGELSTDAVHEQGGKIFAQLWHTGAYSHPDFHNGKKPLAPSDINPNQQVFTSNGLQTTVAPQPMAIEDINQTVADFKQATINALEAGFDGVEVHGATGYLLQQFFSKNSNTRMDAYGGTIENRASIVFEILDALKATVDMRRVGIRLNPSLHGIMGIEVDEETIGFYDYVVHRLNDYGLAYLHLIEPFTDISQNKHAVQKVARHFRNS